MKIKIDNYIFDKVAKSVTFTDYIAIDLDAILLITNVSTNIIIYNFADPLKGGSVLTNVLTLYFDTSAMTNGDALMIYYDDSLIQPSTASKQLADNHQVTVSNSQFPLPADQVTTLTPPAAITGFSTSEKQTDQINIETTLNSLVETLNELIARLAPLASMANAGQPALRTIPIGSVSTAVTGSVTATVASTVVSSLTNFGTSIPASEMAHDINNIAAILGNIDNTIGK